MFIKADALSFLKDPNNTNYFDAFAASPPCQYYSAATGYRDKWPDYIPTLRKLLQATNKPYIIENVVGAPLRKSILLCGSMFGLNVQRHRLFEANFPIYAPYCLHEWQLPRFNYRGKLSRVIQVHGSSGGKLGHNWNEAMGIDWMRKDELVDAVPPIYTRFLGAQLRAFLEHRDLT